MVDDTRLNKKVIESCVLKTLGECLDIDASCAKESVLVFKDLPESQACANAGLLTSKLDGTPTHVLLIAVPTHD